MTVEGFGTLYFNIIQLDKLIRMGMVVISIFIEKIIFMVGIKIRFK